MVIHTIAQLCLVHPSDIHIVVTQPFIDFGFKRWGKKTNKKFYLFFHCDTY